MTRNVHVENSASRREAGKDANRPGRTLPGRFVLASGSRLYGRRQRILDARGIDVTALATFLPGLAAGPVGRLTGARGWRGNGAAWPVRVGDEGDIEDFVQRAH